MSDDLYSLFPISRPTCSIATWIITPAVLICSVSAVPPPQWVHECFIPVDKALSKVKMSLLSCIELLKCICDLLGDVFICQFFYSYSFTFLFHEASSIVMVNIAYSLVNYLLWYSATNIRPHGKESTEVLPT
jgi:hypothetical protein